MKVLLRILTLPLAWLLWTIHYSFHWVINGGELILKNGKPVIKPEEFYRILTEVSERLADFEAQKDEALHWKRLYENYDLEHCGQFVQLQEQLDNASNQIKELMERNFELEAKIGELLKDKEHLFELLTDTKKELIRTKAGQNLTTNNYPPLIIQHGINGA